MKSHDKYLGLYSVDSPGGWYVIGKVETSILDLSMIPPVKMNLGDKVRLKRITILQSGAKEKQ